MDEVQAFLSELSPDDIGREDVAGQVLRFEGFTDLCIHDAVGRTRLPADDPRHLKAFDAVYDEVLAGWSAEEGRSPAETGFCGDDTNPILWARF